MLFSTPRLYCRKIEASDADQYFEIFGAEDVAKFDEFEPITREDADSDIELILQKYISNNTHELELAVCELHHNEMIGVLAAKFEESIAFIGYHFDPKTRGKSFGSEAVKGFVDYLLSIKNYTIAAKVDSENIRSIKLLERVGFTKNENYSEEQFFKGADHIEWSYRLLK